MFPKNFEKIPKNPWKKSVRSRINLIYPAPADSPSLKSSVTIQELSTLLIQGFLKKFQKYSQKIQEKISFLEQQQTILTRTTIGGANGLQLLCSSLFLSWRHHARPSHSLWRRSSPLALYNDQNPGGLRLDLAPVRSLLPPLRGAADAHTQSCTPGTPDQLRSHQFVLCTVNVTFLDSSAESLWAACPLEQLQWWLMTIRPQEAATTASYVAARSHISAVHLHSLEATGVTLRRRFYRRLGGRLVACTRRHLVLAPPVIKQRSAKDGRAIWIVRRVFSSPDSPWTRNGSAPAYSLGDDLCGRVLIMHEVETLMLYFFQKWFNWKNNNFS